ncbi:hypothetical protein [Acetobacterium tundrae]|uniref:Uncharacterized protein n=1 Tax=Acetobacterium tundrae TaxID=132932 RepID=A0ABR6WIU8_9FIRM|nr:hypothetical protein [Acetobacterium tundrae]MBC3796427.1 hypothetical protein [Acetobacterium tundrae]
MAEISGFHNSKDGDRRVKSDFFARFFGSLIGNGVFINLSTGLQVMANGDMSVTVKAGKAWINGVFYENTADMILSLDVADGVLKRIDRVVLQYSTIERTIAAKVKKGTFASSPVAPTLQRDADVWELGIADILVNNGIVSISQANITDLRLNTSLCGIVHGLVDQVDTKTIFNQYLAWFEETKQKGEADFNAFLTDLKNILSGDVAGNLLNLINANTADIASNSEAISSLDTRLDIQERILTATIPITGWSGTAPYSVAITVTGLTDSRPDVNPIYSATLATALLEKESWNKISYINCTANTMTVFCLEEKPTTVINIELVGG